MTVPFWIWSGILAVLPVQEKTASLPDEDVKAIRALFDEIGQAEDSEKAFLEHFDFDRLFEELEPILDAMNLDASSRLGVRAGLRPGLSEEGADCHTWTADSIRRIETLSSGPDGSAREAAVYIRELVAPDITTRSRWWMVKRDGEWLFYDWEDLNTSLRVSALMGAILPQGLDQQPLPKWAEDIERLEQIGALVLADEYEAAEAQIAQLDFTGAPPGIRALLPILQASVFMATGRLNEAAEALGTAEELNPDMPILDYQRAYVWNALGKPQKALASADAYLARFADDVDMIEARADALSLLDREAEAIEAYRQGLTYEPDRLSLLVWMSLLLPADSKDEIGEHLAAMGEPGAAFEELAQTLLDYGDLPALGAAVAAFQKIDPAHHDTAYYAAWWHRESGRPREALTVLQNARVSDPEEAIHHRYLACSLRIELGEAIAAYRESEHPGETFEWIAAALDEHQDFATLAELLSARDERQPEAGPTIWRAVLLRSRGEEKAAADYLLEHRSVLATEEWIEQYEWHLLLALIGAQRYEEALAEARRSTARDGDPYYELVVHAHAGDAKQAISVAEKLEEIGYEISGLYYDSLLSEALQSEALAAFRERFPQQ